MEAIATEALPGTLSTTGYALPAGLDYERWESIGQALQQMQHSLNWWLGDWWVYGERTYGDMASQAVADVLTVAGRSYDQLRWAALVSEYFPPVTRVTSLSWTHHRAVVGLPDQQASAWLTQAAQERWSSHRLSSEVRQAKGHPALRQLNAPQAPAIAPVLNPDLVELCDDLAERIQQVPYAADPHEALCAVAHRTLKAAETFSDSLDEATRRTGMGAR